MTNIFQDNTYSIGRTPLVQLNRVTDGGKARILAKIEGLNPSYSVKCRIGASMVWDAEKRGLLKTGMELVESTSGIARLNKKRKRKPLVVILTDSGERYLSSILYEGLFDAKTGL